MKRVTIFGVVLCVFGSLLLGQTIVQVGPARTYTTLQDAIDAYPAGSVLILQVDPGTYTENINEAGKTISIIGSGNGNNPAVDTIIQRSANAPIYRIQNGGTAATPVLLQNLRFYVEGVHGIEIPAGVSVSYVTIDNAVISGAPTAAGENEVGLWVNTTGSLSNLTITDTIFTGLDYGFYFAKHGDWGPGGSNVSNLTMTDSSFTGNSYKGAYIEKLTNATFQNVSVTGNGLVTFWNSRWNGGIDINLKGQENYQSLIFNNCTFTGNAVGFEEGSALMIKARDDGNTYGSFPAVLNGVSINGGTFRNNERGIRIGEPLRSNNTPLNVVIQNATIDGNTQQWSGSGASAYGGVINYSQSQVDARFNTWDPACTGPTHFANPGGQGDEVYGDVIYNPWNCSSVLTARIDTEPSPAAGIIPLDVTFDCSRSSDSGGSITSCAWNLGNGAVTNGFKVATTYNTAGTYNARLTVTSSSGSTDSSAANVYAHNAEDLTAVLIADENQIKARGYESTIVRIRIYENGELLTHELPLDVFTETGTAGDNISMDSSSGVYSVQVTSGNEGVDTISARINGYTLGTANIRYIWIQGPASAKLEYLRDSGLFVGHWVADLTWSKPQTLYKSIPLAGYKIYRSKVSGDGWELAASVNSDETGYRESVSRNDYSYYIVSVDSTGHESSPVYVE